jgi:hypothetical protein
MCAGGLVAGLRPADSFRCAGLGNNLRPSNPDLAAVDDAWPGLPAAIKAGILAMIRPAN